MQAERARENIKVFVVLNQGMVLGKPALLFPQGKTRMTVFLVRLRLFLAISPPKFRLNQTFSARLQCANCGGQALVAGACVRKHSLFFAVAASRR